MRYFFLPLSLLVAQSAFGQDRVLDSLSTFIKNYPHEDTIKVNTLNELSNQYQWIDFYVSLQYAEQSLTLAKKLHFHRGIASAYYRKGHCYWALGDSELAVEMGLEAVKIAEQEQASTILAESFQILASAYMDQKENDKAVSYINKAEKIALQTKNWDILSRVYNLAGVIEFLDNNEDSALLLYKKALLIAEQYNTPQLQLPMIISNIGECYLESNSDLGFTYFNKALLIARETGNTSAEAGISSVVGRALTKKGKYMEADTYLKSALRLARQLGLRRVIRSSYSGLVTLKHREGKTSEALGYMKNYYEVRDSLLNASKTRQIVELEARHELEKKEQAIKLLEQEKRIERIWKNILFIMILLLGALSVIIYYLQRYHERKNRQILNLEIDNLTTQHKELSEKYKGILTSGNVNSVESVDQRLLKKVIEVVENNISDPLFGVEKMAREVGMSRTNMHRKIKALTGFPPSELIRSIRLRRAAVMLMNQVDSVSQISLAVGYDDHSYFSKAFKKQFGVSPSEYIQSASQEEVLRRSA